MADRELTQVEVFRRMTPSQRFNAANDLYWTARELKAAWFRREHPEWSEERVQREVRRAFLLHRE